MKVDKRYKMYGVKNADFCISMQIEMYMAIQSQIKERYGNPGYVHLVAPRAGTELYRNKIYEKYYYMENDDGVITVYFPKESDIEFIKQLFTVEILKQSAK